MLTAPGLGPFGCITLPDHVTTYHHVTVWLGNVAEDIPERAMLHAL